MTEITVNTIPGLLENAEKIGDALTAHFRAHQPPEHIIQFFACDHLPPHLAAVSQPFGELARTIVETLPRNPERTVALRKLLEAKDAAVRALVSL